MDIKVVLTTEWSAANIDCLKNKTQNTLKTTKWILYVKRYEKVNFDIFAKYHKT